MKEKKQTILSIHLDKRALCYEKERNYEKALSDATEMVKQDKTDIKGYLRAGKLYQLMENYERALKVYEAGLRRVDSGHKLFKVRI